MSNHPFVIAFSFIFKHLYILSGTQERRSSEGDVGNVPFYWLRFLTNIPVAGSSFVELGYWGRGRFRHCLKQLFQTLIQMCTCGSPGPQQVTEPQQSKLAPSSTASVPETLFTVSARRLPWRRQNRSSSMLLPPVQQFTARLASSPRPPGASARPR